VQDWIVVRDSVGFYTSRIFGPYMNKAAWMPTEGVAVDAIDRALRVWGWPVGPITLLDEVGIEIAVHVGPIMIEALGDRLGPPPTMAKLVENDRKARKNGRGFSMYGAAAKRKGKGKHVDPTVYADLGLPMPRRRPQLLGISAVGYRHLGPWPSPQSRRSASGCTRLHWKSRSASGWRVGDLLFLPAQRGPGPCASVVRPTVRRSSDLAVG
jgi:hypothetical protein